MTALLVVTLTLLFATKMPVTEKVFVKEENINNNDSQSFLSKQCCKMVHVVLAKDGKYASNDYTGRRSQGNVSMATTARFPAQAVSGGGDSSPPTPSAASEPSPPPPPPQPTPQLIVLPASLHQATASTVVNGVPVIDVSALEQSADSSNESSASVSGHQGDSTHDSDPTQPSPHFITVTEATARSYASLTPVQPAVVAAEGDTVASHQGYHVQYVEPELYASQPNGAQAQMAYPVYTVGESGTLYASQGQYYAATATGTAASTGTVGYTAGGHYLVQQAVDDGLIASAQQRTSPQTTAAETAYVATATVHSTPTPGQSSEEVTSALSHATRVSPATVQWLLENYETAEGVSLPRSTLYSHYLRHCAENKLEPVNAASFGKLIRSVFLGLRTRRLGTRGNSKYHYYGIRVKPGSNLTGSMDETSRGSSGCMQGSGGNISSSGKGSNVSGRFKRSSDNYDANSSMIAQHHGYLGEGSGAIPDFPEIHFTSPLPEDCSLEDVDTLRSIYREHCEAFLDAVMGLEFATVESLWREFWRAQDNNNGDECEEEKYLSKSKLFALCALEPVQSFVRHVDMQFYQNLVQVLLPDVLRPIPSSLTQAIRNFAKSLESWLTSAMTGCPQAMLNVKLTAVSAFSQSLRRYTSLNHLAQAARAVLHNGTQIAQMLTDLNRVDFHNVQEQASWVCQCDYDIVQRLEADFKLTLQQQNSLEQWAVWLKNVVQNALKPYEGKPNYSKAARQFLLKWSFYSSMVIRDLTLRSAASFGSFHLIRLLYDEYMFYLIEHQVAQATGVTPIAVMTEGNKLNECSETILGIEMPPCNGGVVLSSHNNSNKHVASGSSDGTPSKRMKIS